MKHSKTSFLAIAAAVFSLISCGPSANQQEQGDSAATMATLAPAATPVAHTGKMDPVCEMEYDTSWKENTVYNNDTIHFCSENCKTAFLARPNKYRP